MAKFKPLNENQLVMLPISLQDQLVPDTLEHTISELVENHLDLSVFDVRYNNDESGAAAIHPKILLKVILLAYARGMISSRQIERACQENIIFIALSYGYAPDIARSLPLSLRRKARSRRSSAISCWSARDWVCWMAHTSVWMA